MRIMDLHAMPLAYSNLDLNKQHQKQMKSKIAGLLNEYNIESPKPKGKKATVGE